MILPMKSHRIPTSALAATLLSFALSPALGQTWVQSGAPAQVFWRGLTCSADGQKLLAAAWSQFNLYSSLNGGATWSSNWILGVASPTGIAASADGTSVAAIEMVWAEWPYGVISTSKDGGNSWRLENLPADSPLDYFYWTGVASSADGKCLAVHADRLPNRAACLAISGDFGLTWPIRNTSNYWTSVALSGDGSKIVATTLRGIFLSGDSGQSWTFASALFHNWSSVACSIDGTRMFAVASDGAIGCSTNAGGTWAYTLFPFALSNVACSADGTTVLVAPGQTLDPVHVSRDAGGSWTAADLPPDNWRYVASSADGCKLAAAGKAIYILQTTPRPAMSIGIADTNILVSWTVPSAPFVLQQNVSLAETDWTDVPAQPPLNLTNLKHELRIQPEPGRMFYRLVPR